MTAEVFLLQNLKCDSADQSFGDVGPDKISNSNKLSIIETLKELEKLQGVVGRVLEHMASSTLVIISDTSQIQALRLDCSSETQASLLIALGELLQARWCLRRMIR